MKKYYVYCERHKIVSDYFESPAEASEARRKYLTENQGSHGNVYVVERYIRNVYGNEEIRYRQYRKRVD